MAFAPHRINPAFEAQGELGFIPRSSQGTSYSGPVGQCPILH